MTERLAMPALATLVCLATFLCCTVLAQEPQSLGAIGVADNNGIRLTEIVSRGPAEIAGLAVGDVITAIDGKPLKQIAEKAELMTRKQVGSQVVVTYLRAGRPAKVTLVIGAANEPTSAAKATRDSPRKTVSAEFAKAANLALVAIKNSQTMGDTPDQIVTAAINDADAAAISESETAVLTEIKVLARMRPLVLEILTLTESAPAGSGAHNGWLKGMADLQREYDCIAAWRLALRNLSGDKPKECEAMK